MISLLPGSQASEIDACVSLQLVKETGTETLCAYKQVAVCRWGPSVFTVLCLHLKPLLRSCFTGVIMLSHLRWSLKSAMQVCFLQESCLQCRPVYRPQLPPLCYVRWRTEAQEVCRAVAFILAVKPSKVVKATKRSREVYMKNAGVMVPGQSPWMPLEVMNLLVCTSTSCLTE